MYPSNGYLYSSFPSNDFNPNSETQGISASSSSCLFDFPSLLNQYEDDEAFFQYLHAINSQYNLDNVGATNEMTFTESTAISNQNHVDMKEHMCVGRSADHQPEAKKTVSKKDRHTKVQTARGPRDPRVRLSLDISKKFFGLQDLLGSNNSKTIEWLFEHSKPAIQELSTGQFPHMNKGSGLSTNSASSSNCEIVYGINEHSVPETASTKTDELPASTRSNMKRTKRVRGPSFDHFMTKESRTKARERARERKRKRKHEQLDDQQSTNLMNWSPIGAGNELAGSHNTISYNSPHSLDEVDQVQNACEQQKTSQQNPNKFVITERWSPSALFNYQHNSEIFNEYHFADFQFDGYHDQIGSYMGMID